MKKTISKIVAIAMAFVLVAGFTPINAVSHAKAKDPIESIKVTNKSDFQDMTVGDTLKIKTKITYISNLSAKEKAKISKLKYSSNDKKVAKVNSAGKVTAVGPGKTKIIVQFKESKISNKKCSFTVEVESDYDMVFKYSNLYFIVPNASAFPVTIKKGGKDAQNSIFDIKTANFTAAFSDFNYFSENGGVADIDAKSEALILNGYGYVEIEAEYKKDSDVGDNVDVYVLTQEQFDEMVAAGEIEPEEENRFEDEDDDEDETPDPNEVIDTDESEDEE